MNFSLYLNHDSFLHKVNPTIKYIILIIWFISIPLLPLSANIIQIFILQIFIFLGRIPFWYLQKKFKFLIPLAIFTYLFLQIYPLLDPSFAISLTIRIYVMFAAVLIINSTTALIELVTLFRYLAQKLFKHDQVQDVIMIFILVINFLPLIASELIKINQSLHSRNVTIKNSRLSYLKVFLQALIIRLDNLVDELELIFYSRNITVSNIDNVKFENKIKKEDYFFLGLCIIITSGLVVW